MNTSTNAERIKHELVNSLAALRSVHSALESRKNIEDADELLVNVISKLDRLKAEITTEDQASDN
jgi:hypothetical protein